MSQQTLEGQEFQEQEEKTWIKQYPVKNKTPEGILEKAEKIFTITEGKRNMRTQPPSYWVASSGGGDSMITASILHKQGKLAGIFHIEIPGGVKETTDFLKEECKRIGWRLEIRNPYPKFIMVALILETGFPSTFLHPMYMRELKQKTMAKFVNEKGIKETNPVLVTGIRKFESERRLGNFKYPIQIDDKKTRFVCPIFYWKDDEKYRYKLENNIRVTPVHEKLGHSGECPCGSFAHKNEAIVWNQLDPESSHFLKWLEYGVRHFSSKRVRELYSTWGGQGMTESESQEFLDKFYTKRERDSLKIAEAMVCGVECGPGTMRGLMG